MTHKRRMFEKGSLLLMVCSTILLAPALPMGGARAQDSRGVLVPGGAVVRVTEVRRILRSACGNLQHALAEEDGRAEWLAQAEAEVQEAQRLWKALRSEFPETGPGPYAALPEWSGTAGEITDGLQDMLAKTRAGEAAAARTACGQNCGRFTALNEGAGLELAPDALFRFRQAARPLGQLIASEDLESMRSVLPRLEELRSRAMEWPATSSVAPRERMANLEAFSACVDGFAEALRAGRDVAGAYAAMMKALEQAYDAIL